ncbi:DUF1223 domain-containing protein [Flavobacterium sp. UBA7682]|uniref:DUF1223 domain-containing protein n=1 Tax=Flavobacterium sp. UBA7682 TaxID=1946560 RepID=UPI0025B8167D|nr:DUF1223 domain-containing protein [Flavobacterium sp. UBA7682]
MKESITKTILYSGIVIISLTLSSFTLQKLIQKKEEKSENKGFAVLELFTSQGCSSCPPADAVLGKYALQNNPNIIPLAFHVDYWNYIGWKDPFSKAEFSNRQRDYAKKMNTKGTYTPQVIINGKYELIGSKESEIQNKVTRELANPSKENIAISEAVVTDGKLRINYNVKSISQSGVVNVALVKKKEFTAIKRGENSGLKQTSYNIVVGFKTVPLQKKKMDAVEFDFPKEWLPSDFTVVAYSQSSLNGVTTAATQATIQN